MEYAGGEKMLYDMVKKIKCVEDELLQKEEHLKENNIQEMLDYQKQLLKQEKQKQKELKEESLREWEYWQKNSKNEQKQREEEYKKKWEQVQKNILMKKENLAETVLLESGLYYGKGNYEGH